MRVITQNVSQLATDPDGIATNQSGLVAGDELALDGVLASPVQGDGRQYVDLRGDYGVGSVIEFTTGVTGSTALATIVGRDLYNAEVTEVVTLPGASLTVSSTTVFGYISSITVDGAATNLSAGIPAGEQLAPWIPMDHNASGINVTVSVELVSGTVNYTMDHTLQGDLLTNGPEPDNFFADTVMSAETASSVAQIAQPVTASRIKINSGTAAVLRIKYLQAGAGNK
jgi:hypothetical protein